MLVASLVAQIRLLSGTDRMASNSGTGAFRRTVGLGVLQSAGMVQRLFTIFIQSLEEADRIFRSARHGLVEGTRLAGECLARIARD